MSKLSSGIRNKSLLKMLKVVQSSEIGVIRLPEVHLFPFTN